MERARLKDRRNIYEDEVLKRLHEVLPPGVHVTVLADRGFGDKMLDALLKHLGFDFVIGFRGDITVESHDGEVPYGLPWCFAGRASGSRPVIGAGRGRAAKSALP